MSKAALLHPYRDLFEKRAVAGLVTLMPDGSPQVTPMWFEFDGKDFIINGAKGKVKDRNIRRDPRVALLISDPENAYRYVQIRGRVVAISEEEAEESLARLAQKYLGTPHYPDDKPGEVRVMYRISPEHVSGIGG